MASEQVQQLQRHCRDEVKTSLSITVVLLELRDASYKCWGGCLYKGPLAFRLHLFCAIKSLCHVMKIRSRSNGKVYRYSDPGEPSYLHYQDYHPDGSQQELVVIQPFFHFLEAALKWKRCS